MMEWWNSYISSAGVCVGEGTQDSDRVVAFGLLLLLILLFARG